MGSALPTLVEIEVELRRRRIRGVQRADPVAFVHDYFDWGDRPPTEYQDEILAELPVRRRVAVRSPHGAGKTTVAALATLHFALSRDPDDWKCPVTASSWRQLTKYFWPEVHKWTRKIRWDKLERVPFDPRFELQLLSLKLLGGEAFAVASDKPYTIEGAHADHIFYVFDEAKSIPDDTWDAAEGAFSTAGRGTEGQAMALAISTPGPPSGRFYDIHARKAGFLDWWPRHITLDEAVRAGRIAQDWADLRKRQWGEESPIYRTRVLGEFASSEDTSVIPLAWVEAAVERWHEWRDAGGLARASQLTSVGVDVGLTAALTVLAPRVGDVVESLREHPRVDTTQTAGFVRVLTGARGGVAVIDANGIGAGVFHQLRETKSRAVAFMASGKTEARDKSGELGFVNLRAAAWWGVRERLDPQYSPTTALPPDDDLVAELTAPGWWMTSTGKIQIEEKAEVAKRLRRSTDKADAVVMAFALELLQPILVTGSPMGIASAASYRGFGG